MKNKKNLTKKFLTATATISIIMAAGAAWSQVESEILANQLNLVPDNSIKDLAGVTSLMSAVANNDIEGVKFFSNAGQQTINEKNIGGATALNIAARSNNIEAAKILLANNADINLADNEGWTPLMRAARNANAEMVDLLLLNNADIYALNSESNGAVVHSVISDCEKCLENILAKIDIKNPQAEQKIMPQLMNAFQVAQNKKNEKVKIILAQYSDRKNNLADKSSGIQNIEPSNFGAHGSVKYVLRNSSGDSSFENSVIIIAPKDSVQVSQIKYERETNVVISNASEPPEQPQIRSKFKFVTDEDKSMHAIQNKNIVADDNDDEKDHVVSNNVEIIAGTASYKLKQGSPKINYVKSIEETTKGSESKKKWAFVVGKSAENIPSKPVKKVIAKPVKTNAVKKPVKAAAVIVPKNQTHIIHQQPIQDKQVVVKSAKPVEKKSNINAKSAEQKVESVTVKEAVTFKYIPQEKK